jgi:hypothetical protein
LDPFWVPAPPIGTSVDTVGYAAQLNPEGLSSYRGCRKLCASSPFVQESTECGSYVVEAGKILTRCRKLIDASFAKFPPSCSCNGTSLLNAVNTNVKQTNFLGPELVEWIPVGINSTTCRPKCLFCFEVAGTCRVDECAGTPGFAASGKCQYTGPLCDTLPCAGSSDHVYNVTSGLCVCKPEWLYDTSGICTEEHTLCAESGGTLPVGWEDSFSSSSCICNYPLKVDMDPTSSTVGLCLSSCGVYGTPMGAECRCITGGVISGALCNETHCENGGTPVIISSPSGPVHSEQCSCPLAQWSGVLCHENACVGGLSRTAPASGCDCYWGWNGTLCDLPSGCGGHGKPSTLNASSVCVCDPGWMGLRCEKNMCALAPSSAVHHETQPQPCTTEVGAEPQCLIPGYNYNCLCGDGFYATFNISNGMACCLNHTSLDCGAHGNWGVFVHNNSYHCICDTGWAGYRCDHHVCPVSGLSHRHTMVMVTNETDGHPYWECECNPGYSDKMGGCGINCSYFAAIYPETTVHLIQDPTDINKCKCDDGVSVFTRDPPTWLNESHSESQGWHCAPPCDQSGTARPTVDGCVCRDGWAGPWCQFGPVEPFILTISAPDTDMPPYSFGILGGAMLAFGLTVLWWSSGSMPSFMYMDRTEQTQLQTQFTHSDNPAHRHRDVSGRFQRRRLLATEPAQTHSDSE